MRIKLDHLHRVTRKNGDQSAFNHGLEEGMLPVAAQHGKVEM